MSKKTRCFCAFSTVLALLGAAALLLALVRRPTPTEELAGAELYRADGGQSAAPAVLLVSHPGDGGEYLLRELNRRGVHVLRLTDTEGLAKAWEALTMLDGVRLSSLGLLARGRDIPAALELTEKLSGGGREPAAVILGGTGEDAALCAGSPGRDLLYLAGGMQGEDTTAAFYGDDTPAGEISGYFADGDARRLEVLSGSVPPWGSRETMLLIFDWLGSSLGHAVELPDDDIATAADKALLRGGVAASVIAVAGGVLTGRAHRRKTQKEQP